MTEKDYRKIASIVACIREDAECVRITEMFCDMLKEDNPRFCPSVFRTAVSNWHATSPKQEDRP